MKQVNSSTLIRFPRGALTTLGVAMRRILPQVFVVRLCSAPQNWSLPKSKATGPGNRLVPEDGPGRWGLIGVKAGAAWGCLALGKDQASPSLVDPHRASVRFSTQLPNFPAPHSHAQIHLEAGTVSLSSSIGRPRRRAYCLTGTPAGQIFSFG